jgi:hypothetical protein
MGIRKPIAGFADAFFVPCANFQIFLSARSFSKKEET